MVISRAQCRAARALLEWTQDRLAETASVSKKTVVDFEAGKRTPYDRTIADIGRAFEAAGIQFIPENGGGAGVRFRERQGSGQNNPDPRRSGVAHSADPCASPKPSV